MASNMFQHVSHAHCWVKDLQSAGERSVEHELLKFQLVPQSSSICITGRSLKSHDSKVTPTWSLV